MRLPTCNEYKVLFIADDLGFEAHESRPLYRAFQHQNTVHALEIPTEHLPHRTESWARKHQICNVQIRNLAVLGFHGPTRNPDTLAFLERTPTCKRFLHFTACKYFKDIFSRHVCLKHTDTLFTNAYRGSRNTSFFKTRISR